LKTDLKKYGLIGFPLSHTFSPTYFKKKFDKLGITNTQYDAYPIDKIEKIIPLFNQLNGINVTIPYKQSVMQFLDVISHEAQAIGAVNTILITANGKKFGYNSDVYGFEQSLLPLIKPQHNKALVLGTGGAALAVCFVLEKLNIEFCLVSRNKKEGVLTYKDISHSIVKDHTIIINTTPLGMAPFSDNCPNIPYNAIDEHHLLYDLIYNPEETLFLKKGKAKKAVIKNGLEMLHLQAEKSWSIWQEEVSK